MATTTVQPLPYPSPTGVTPDVPRDIKALAEAVENRVVMRFASTAARDAAIPAGQRIAGMQAFVDADQTLYVWSTAGTPGWRPVNVTWRPYTPTLSSGTPGTAAGRYAQVGDSVHLYVTVTLTAALSGGFGVSLPVSAAGVNLPIGQAYLADASGSGNAARRIWSVYTTFAAQCAVMDGSSGALIAPTVPWTWASGDTITIVGTYPAAA